MIMQIMGLLDFICVLVLFCTDIVSLEVAKYAALYLIIKGLIFIMFDWLSIPNYIDVTIGVYIFLMYYFGISSGLITGIFIFYLLQKLFFCFIGCIK